MIDTNKLKGEIKAKGFTQVSLSKELGITVQTFNRKLGKGIFNSNEIQAMIDILSISDPMNIFFVS